MSTVVWNAQGHTRFFFHEEKLILCPPGVNTSLRVWMCAKMGFTQEQADASIRGYISPGKIVFFEGVHYRPSKTISNQMLTAAYTAYVARYTGAPTIYNGVYEGTPGEEWECILRWDSTRHIWVIAQGLDSHQSLIISIEKDNTMNSIYIGGVYDAVCS